MCREVTQKQVGGSLGLQLKCKVLGVLEHLELVRAFNKLGVCFGGATCHFPGVRLASSPVGMIGWTTVVMRDTSYIRSGVPARR